MSAVSSCWLNRQVVTPRQQNQSRQNQPQRQVRRKKRQQPPPQLRKPPQLPLSRRHIKPAQNPTVNYSGDQATWAFRTQVRCPARVSNRKLRDSRLSLLPPNV